MTGWRRGVFAEVAKALQEYPVVTGRAEFTDRDGKTTDVEENEPRMV